MKTVEEYSKEWSNNPEIPFEDIVKKVQKEAYNQALEDAIALRKRTGNPYNKREGKAMLNFEIEARKLKK